jgi:hypothetical protein
LTKGIEMSNHIISFTIFLKKPHQDIPNPDPQPEDYHKQDRTIKVGTVGGRDAWWEEKSKTHRQAIIDAVAQIIVE